MAAPHATLTLASAARLPGIGGAARAPSRQSQPRPAPARSGTASASLTTFSALAATTAPLSAAPTHTLRPARSGAAGAPEALQSDPSVPARHSCHGRAPPRGRNGHIADV